MLVYYDTQYITHTCVLKIVEALVLDSAVLTSDPVPSWPERASSASVWSLSCDGEKSGWKEGIDETWTKGPYGTVRAQDVLGKKSESEEKLRTKE